MTLIQLTQISPFEKKILLNTSNIALIWSTEIKEKHYTIIEIRDREVTVKESISEIKELIQAAKS